MNNNIEQLKTEVDNITDSLKKLKENVSLSESEKKTQAESLKAQAEATKQKIENEIKALENATDDVSKKNKEEAEALLSSFNEIMNLYKSIINTGATNVPSQQPLPETENKSVFSKAKDWIGDQRSDVWDKEKWETEGGTNLLRTVGFAATGIGAVSLAYKGIKKLFGRGKDKEEEDDEETEKKSKKKKKKKSFWKTGVGKFLKWTTVGAAGVFGINKLGKRLGRWGDGGATGRDSDKEKLESYEEAMKKPENKEKFENYEGLGDKVDNVYQEMFDRELKSGCEDELEMAKIAKEQSKGTKFYKGIVPYCLDNQFKSVDGILGQNSSFKTALYDGLDGMVNFVKNAGGEFLKLFAECYLEFLPSWMPFKNAAGSLGDKIDQWKIKNKDAEKEMQYFFRQSIRVQTYLSEKKDQLTKKIVKDAAQKYGKSEDDIWKDKDLFEKYVEKDPQYQNFLNSPTHSAVTVLAQNNLFDNHIDEDLKQHVAEIDEDRNKILGCKNGEKDIIEAIYNKKQKSEILDANDDKKLGEACDGILNSMDSIIDAAEDSVWNIYEDLFRSGDSNLREYLKRSGLDKMFESYKQILLAKKQELINGKLSNEDKIALAETINGMLYLKKEVELGQVTIEKDYDEHGNIIVRIPGFLYGSVKNLIKGVNKLIHGEWGEGLAYIGSGFLGTGGAIALVGGVRCLIDVKTGKKIASFGGKMVFSPAWVAYKGASQIKPLRDFGHKINPLKYRGKKGAETLLQDLVDGRVSLERAGNTIKRRCFPTIGSGETEKAWKGTFNVTEKMKEGFDMRKAAFDSIVKKQVTEYYLADIKKDSQLYDELVKNRDMKPEIGKAIQSQKPIEELKKISKLSSAGDAAEAASDIRKAFDASIDKAIKRLDEWGNKELAEIHINKLKGLKSDMSLADDEMEGFVKFMDKGFDAKLIPDIKKLFGLTDEVKDVGKVGEKLKQLFNEGKYSEFKRLLKQEDLGKIFKKSNIAVDDIVKNFDGIFKKFGGMAADAVKSLVKSFVKLLGKIF